MTARSSAEARGDQAREPGAPSVDVRALDPLMETSVDGLTKALVIQADYLAGLSPVMHPTDTYIKARQRQLEKQIVQQEGLTHRLKQAQLKDAWWQVKTHTFLRWSTLAMVGLTDIGAIALVVEHLGDADTLTKLVVAMSAGGALNGGAALLAGRARRRRSQPRAIPRHAQSAGEAAVRSRAAKRAAPRSTR